MNQRESHREIFVAFERSAYGCWFVSKKLGIAAGIDEFVASTRINRYEKGVHEADIHTAQKLAETLNVPLAYFYVEDDELATIVMNYENLSEDNKKTIIKIIDKNNITK